MTSFPKLLGVVVLELCCHVYFNTSTRPSHTIDCDCLAEDNADKIFGASVATGVIKHVNQYRAILWKESRKTGQYDADFLSIASSGADARCLDASSHDAGSRQENAPSCSFSVVTWQDVVKRWREGKRRKHETLQTALAFKFTNRASTASIQTSNDRHSAA